MKVYIVVSTVVGFFIFDYIDLIDYNDLSHLLSNFHAAIGLCISK